MLTGPEKGTVAGHDPDGPPADGQPRHDNHSTDHERWSYAAFISYKSGRSRWKALRLRRGLRAVARRHPNHPDFNVFLDRASLRTGPLESGIRTALSQSRSLIVVLDRDTHRSKWVCDEIEFWLQSVGPADRIHLVRADRKVDLSWTDSGDKAGFAHPDHLPAPLRKLFRTEQAWLEFTGWEIRSPETDLARLCAGLMNADPREFFIEESAFQRRRRNRLVAVIVVMAMLATAASGAAVAALRSRNQAERNRIAALAQADAAEALLAAADSPTLAIQRAIQASGRSGSSTVRSAMLAVSQEARRLRRALTYPEDVTGHPPSAAAFDQDGKALLAWGPGRSSASSFLQIWAVPRGDVQFSGAVDVSNLEQVVRTSPDTAVGCSRSGPVKISLTGGRAVTSLLDPRWNANGERPCEVASFGGGVLVLTPMPGADRARSAAYYVDRHARVSRIAGVDSAASHPSSRWAVLAGPSGVTVVSPEGLDKVHSAGVQEATFADSRGHFLIHIGPTTWGEVRPAADGWSLHRVAVPAGAVDVAPLLDGGDMTGQLAWIKANGTVGWSKDARTTKVTNSQGQSTWPHYRTALVPLAWDDFVAIFGNTATVVRPPTGEVVADAPPEDWPGPGYSQWSQKTVKQRLGAPQRSGASAVVAQCPARHSVLIATDLPENGSLLIDGAATAMQLGSRGQFSANCDAVDAGASLSAIPWLNSERIPIRTNLVADSVAVSPSGSQIAVVRAGLPIEVLSTVPDDELPRPWAAEFTYRKSAVTAFGEQEVFIEDQQLVTTDRDGSVERIDVPDLGDLVAARPDGAGGVWESLGPSPQRRFAGPRQSANVAPACSSGRIDYVPEPGFQTSVAAAEAQVPVVDLPDGSQVDCRTGAKAKLAPSTSILSYDVGRDRGRIVSRSVGHVVITTWTRGRRTRIESTPAPVTSGETDLSLDDSSQVALTHVVGGRELVVHRRQGGAWRRTLTVTTGIGDLAGVGLVDGGTLIIAVTANGGFELYDAESGRRLVHDPNLTIDGVKNVTGFSAVRAGDELFVYLQTDHSVTASGTIDIPVGVEALKRQLCDLYAAPAC